MPSFNIPGVTDKYNTNNTVERLMEVERVPLVREQETLKTYQSQQNAWRDINMKLSSLRDDVRSLYSYDSPFVSKIAESSEAAAVTADAGHAASFGSFNIDVIETATADRFLSDELEKDMRIDAGTYVFESGDKKVTMKFNGGTVNDFVTSLNRRGDGTFHANIINSGASKKVLLIESLKTGSDNRLTFDKDALELARKIGMIGTAEDKTVKFGTSLTELSPAPLPESVSITEQVGMPELTLGQISEDSGKPEVVLQPRSSVSIALPESVMEHTDDIINFTITATETEDITIELNKLEPSPVLPNAGAATFSELTIENFPSDTTLPVVVPPPEPLNPIETEKIVYAVMADGSERLIETPALLSGEGVSVTIDMKEYSGITAIAIKNRNTGNTLSVSKITATDRDSLRGYEPLHAVTKAHDATIKYEGITIQRPSNTIDDVVPDVTLKLSDKTDKTATITIKGDAESAKDALITFVGQYNQTVAELNVLTQNKQELISELTYLSDSDKDALSEKLGIFQGDFTLTNIKNSMQSIITASYASDENTTFSLLSQLGISTNATGSTGYNASRLRGYLEIDERTLDRVLESNMEDLRRLFGRDTDGDLIVDSGIGYRLDQQLTAYTQSNGILTTKANTLNSQISASEQRISRLETQLDARERQLRQQFGQMESAVNSLESQQTAIDNFMQQNNFSGNRRR